MKRLECGQRSNRILPAGPDREQGTGSVAGERKKEKKEKKVKSLSSRVQLFATVAHQAPPSMEFSRQEYWSGCHFLLQGIFPTQGSNPGLPHCGQTLYRLSHQGIHSGWRGVSQFCFHTFGQYAGKLWGPSLAPSPVLAVVPTCGL